MRKILGTMLVAALFAAGVAQAQAPAASGISLGVRAGYGIPMGDLDSGESMTDFVASGQIPLQLDAMYRFTRNWSVGLYFQYGFSFVPDTMCPSGFGLSCSASDVRLGAQLHYRFDSTGFVPWVGFGIGYEWFSATLSGPGGSGDYSFDGLEYLNLQLGGDWLLSPNFRLGPYVQFTIAQYDNAEINMLGTPLFSGSIPNKAVHEWLQFGVKGTFDL